MPPARITSPEDVGLVPGCLNTDLEKLIARRNRWLLPPKTPGKLIPSATLENVKWRLRARSSARLKSELYKGAAHEGEGVETDGSVVLTFSWQGKSSRGEAGNNERMRSFKTRWHLFC